MFHKIFSEMHCEILHTDFTKTAALRKFWFAAACSCAPWAHSHCYNAYCRQSSQSSQIAYLLQVNLWAFIPTPPSPAPSPRSASISIIMLSGWFSIIIMMINLEYWLMLSIGTSNANQIMLLSSSFGKKHLLLGGCGAYQHSSCFFIFLLIRSSLVRNVLRQPL